MPCVAGMKADRKAAYCRKSLEAETASRPSPPRLQRRGAPAFLVRLLGKTRAECLCEDRATIPRRD